MNQCNRTAFDKEMNKLYCNFPCPGSCNQTKENYIPRGKCSRGTECQRRCWRSFGRRHALRNDCLRRNCGCNI